MSRLLKNANQLRDSLESRNLYTPEDPYNANASKAVNTINRIAGIVSPFTAFDLSNTVVGRLVGNNTPLAQIGLEMLARQFKYSAASNASAEYLPAIKFENLFDGDPNTKFLSVPIDYQITRRESQSNIGKILEEISGRYPTKNYPFGRNSTNVDYIKNSGKGQLQLLVKSLNANKYKPSTQTFQNSLTSKGFKYGDKPSVDYINYFLSNNTAFHPYNQYKTSLKEYDIVNINNKLNAEIVSFRTGNDLTFTPLEYGSSQQYVDGLGKSSNINLDDFSTNGQNNYGLNDDLSNKLIWGRDGVSDVYNKTRSKEKNNLGVQPSESGDFVGKINRFDFNDNEKTFNLKAGGLLSFTRELLNSKGRYSTFDITKKEFTDVNEEKHYNGSPLTKHVNGVTVDKNRQHSIIDPYDNYVKAIRYNGNKIYNGNANSVIYNAVIPQITPTNGGVSNKNLMFSIENLAIEVNAAKDNPTIAYVNDDSIPGTELPICELGANGGRLMWFPPYDIQISENITVNRTSTNFIGRGEPIYTYNNTERMANLSFKLLIDYPPQVRGLNHVQASRFFAFGGDNPPSKGNLGDKIKKKEDLIKEKKSIEPTKKQSNPQIDSDSMNFFFANDQPKTAGITNSIYKHIGGGGETNPLYYEVDKEGDPDWQGPDGRNTRLNNDFQTRIDNAIRNLLNEELIKFIEINIVATASVLFNAANGADYNQRLSERRVEAIKSFIKARYRVIYNKELKDSYGSKPLFVTDAGGQVGGTATDDTAEIPSNEAKQARSGSITFQYNNTTELVPVPITEKQIKDIEVIDGEIEILETEINNLETRNAKLTGCEFTPYTIEDGILKGFKSTENNKYQPVFHSQTPEDFHRRLTFLQQCTRQGKAIRKTKGTSNNSFSANNSVFGRQPVQILRIGDMFHTKIFIDNLQIDYSEAPWDMNPEGMGMQFMIAEIKLQLKLVGGQSLKGPINALQNAISYNFYANSTFYNNGVYKTASDMENLQYSTQDADNLNTVKSTTEESAQNNKTDNLPNQ